ncbi:hypothetical protein CF336_g2974 [Tilletia laevis]|nr:hypothetical protein CF336_g2974 [Tilletia laevis]
MRSSIDPLSGRLFSLPASHPQPQTASSAQPSALGSRAPPSLSLVSPAPSVPSSPLQRHRGELNQASSSTTVNFYHYYYSSSNHAPFVLPDSHHPSARIAQRHLLQPHLLKPVDTNDYHNDDTKRRPTNQPLTLSTYRAVFTISASPL